MDVRMDFGDVLKELMDHLNDVYWTIGGLHARPDLSGFQQQSTDMKTLPMEFVDQRGCGDHGFGGTIYFPTEYSDGDGGKLFLRVDFSG
ncbi:hypothetical protein [Thioalbus denitrificans]|uniref:Uncharacterized protein n=1 Tax=Thioalbus denitrificans TaxID=547122 RepID=A0A369CG51_9GAMM|nr:hypothetical protein [Thioalbus denitrificans]RCX32065.1 hypothetical protein DFQ59_102418 [Thioalbus denitrificans]